MKARMIEHGMSLLLVGALLSVFLFIYQGRSQKVETAKSDRINRYVPETGADFSDPVQTAIFRDVMDLYYPGRADANEAAVNEVVAEKSGLARASGEAASQSSLTGEKAVYILLMYLRFLIVYAIVMLLTYYGVLALGLWRYVHRQRKAHSVQPKESFTVHLFKRALVALASFVLFTPAYTIAYSLRTEIATDSAFFMVILGVVSNGLLITYSNKFYHLLVTEGRKGYVEAALACGLSDDWTAERLPARTLFSLRKRFDGHVLSAVFENARFQYVSTLKEQAVFLMTGLVIIEMALNIHGYFSYEMLRQLLFGNVDTVLFFFLLMFAAVKATEAAADWLHYREARRYENP